MGESRRTLAALLTHREVQVLKCVAKGLSDREIALRLLIFEPAVRAHIRSACEKLGVHARAHAAADVERRVHEVSGRAEWRTFNTVLTLTSRRHRTRIDGPS